MFCQRYPGKSVDVYESLIFISFEKVRQNYAKEKQKELGFDRSSMVNVFKVHKTDNVKVLLATNNTDLVLVPAGCTSKCQPLDVCINKPYKAVLHNFSEDNIATIGTELTETDQQRESFNLPSRSRQDTVNWIAEGINFLKNHPDIIENLFRVCGMTTNDASKK